jgi:hypothetical protein
MEWIGDVDPQTIDCGFDMMAAHRMNHAYFFIEMRKGQFDTPISEPFNFKISVKWREKFWQGLRALVEYAHSLDIICQIILFSEALLEPGKDRWEQHIFSDLNGGPVPDDGLNFYRLQLPNGYPDSWNWKQWNTYYQGCIVEKVIETVGDFPNVIFNPCWEISNIEQGLDWFRTIVHGIQECESGEFEHLICITPITPGILCELECADLIMIENRGIGYQYLVYGKPVLNGGPSAKHKIFEPEFIYTCALYGIHPSTNLLKIPPEKSDGYEYCCRLQTFIDDVRIWQDEPGVEISESTLPWYSLIWGVKPLLGWTGEEGYEEDGTNPDWGYPHTKFDFHVTYTDFLNSPPATAELWIDKNQDGIFQFEERYRMCNLLQEENYVDGVIFFLEDLNFESSLGEVRYKFNFANEYWLPANGVPGTKTHHIRVLKTAER